MNVKLLLILLDVIGFYYVLKVFISYYKYGFYVLDISVLKYRSYYVCLFTLCFFGVSLARYIITESGWQISFAVIHGLSMIVNYNLYKSYKKMELENEN